MNQSKVLDNLRLHNIAGTLSMEVSMRGCPRVQIDSNLTPLVRPRVHVQWPYDPINTPSLRSVLLAKSYSAFYPGEMETISSFSLMGSMANMLMNMILPRLVDQDGQLDDAFKSAGMDLVVDAYRTLAEVIALLHDRKVIAFLEQFPGRN
jgi:hypothetical protein